MPALFKRSSAARAGAKAASRSRAVRKPPSGERRGVLARVGLVALVVLACTIPVVFVASPISYIPLVAVIVVTGISYAYLRVLARSLGYSEDSLADSCERGSEIQFAVTFKNRSPLPFVRLEPFFYISDLFGGVDTAIPATMTLMPHEERVFRFEASFEHLGTYSAGVSRIVIGDLLGLFSHTIENAERHEVKVLPRVFDVSKVDLSTASSQESNKASQPIVTDDMDYAGVREYVWGDPLKTIHWKLSSASPQGEYFTRLFEAFANPGLTVIIDHQAPDLGPEPLMQVFDGLVESAVSVSLHARQLGVDATIAFTDTCGELRQMRILNVGQAASLIEGVPRVSIGDGREGLDLLQRECRSVHGEGSVAFCTANVSEEMISTLLDAKAHKRNPVLFLVVPKTLEGRKRQDYIRPLRRLESARVPYFAISDARELEGGSEHGRG